MKLLTEYPSYYKEISLPDTMRKMLVPIMQETLKQLTWYDLLELPNRKMEAVRKLKYILLDDGSTSSPYAGLLIERVVNPIMKWLKEMWTPTKFPQQEQLVQFLHNLPPEFLHDRDFLHDVVLPRLSSAPDRYDASWEIVLVNVFLHPWMLTIDRGYNKTDQIIRT
jgi:hypothetical protein